MWAFDATIIISIWYFWFISNLFSARMWRTSSIFRPKRFKLVDTMTLQQIKSICVSVCPSVRLYVIWCVCLCVYLPVCLSVCVSIYASNSESVNLVNKCANQSVSVSNTQSNRQHEFNQSLCLSKWDSVSKHTCVSACLTESQSLSVYVSQLVFLMVSQCRVSH